MSVTTTTPSPCVDRGHRRVDLGLLRAAVVVGVDRDRRGAGALADHMLHRCEILAGQTAVRDDNDSDHAVPTPTAAASSVARSSSRCRIDTCQPSAASVFASASTTATDRCRPPVQPTAEAEVALPLRPVGREQEADEIGEPRVERRIGRVGLDEGAHRRVAPVERPKLRLPVRVLQEAHVDHHVGAARHAALVGEGLQRHRQPAAVLLLAEVAPPSRRAARAASSRGCRSARRRGRAAAPAAPARARCRRAAISCGLSGCRRRVSL